MKTPADTHNLAGQLPTGSGSRQEAWGESDAFLDFQERLARVARVNRPVLLVGERGTGKELAAARVHFLSLRWGGPLVKLNCAALSPSVLESELFGHELGAFTGATRRRVGRFEAAHGGTLFLDEVGQMPMPVQEKILRVVEYGSFERVGASEVVSVDVRLVGATNADLPAMAAAGQFKPDLLDRLSFDVLRLPSLRERGPGDVELLARQFAVRMALELGRPEAPEFAEAARRALLTHPWPGNVRELKNVVERAVYRAADNVVREVVFNPFTGSTEPGTSLSAVRGAPPLATVPGPVELPGPDAGSEEGGESAPGRSGSVDLAGAVAALELRLLRGALKAARWRQRDAAGLLGLTYDQFRGLYRKYQGQVSGNAEPPSAPISEGG